MKNLLTAVVLSAAVLLGFEYYMLKNAPEVTPEEGQAQAEEMLAVEEVSKIAKISTVQATPQTEMAPVPFFTEHMVGEINLKGGLPSKLTLRHYKAHGEDSTLDGNVELINGAPFTQQLTMAYEAGGLDVPHQNTVWALTQKGEMTQDAPTILTFKNTSGQTFSRELYFKGYVLHVEDTVVNGASVPVSLQKVNTVTRFGGQKAGETSSWYNSFGPQGLVRGESLSHSYKKLEKGSANLSGEDGFWGFTEQYFAVLALAPSNIETTRRFKKAEDSYEASLAHPVSFVAASGGAQFDSQFYLGPKRVESLSEAGHMLDSLVDYGWFDFIARPMFWLMNYFHDNWFSNWGWSIVALTVVLKLLTYPLAAKSYRSMGKLRKIQPEVKAIQEKYKDGGREQMAGEMMALYKKHGVNPMSGCWPMFIQIPIFFAMYKMVLLTFELRGAEFILWIHDLSVADPFFVLPILMGLSMMIQMRLSPTMGDPMQAKIMQFMPIVFTALFLFFPSGLVLYWLTNNVISVAQQWYFMRSAELSSK